VANIKVGQQATLTFPAVTSADNPTGLTADGTVTAIAPTATVSSSVVTYPVTITLASPPAGLRIGQTATVTVTTAEQQDVLRVASNAITAAGPAKTVQLKSGNSARTVVITTGITGGGFTEITSGVTAGDVLNLPSLSTTSTNTGTFGGRGGIGGAVGGR
jgi:multidrug efflux pump subunit AcrA (membrane-fusion protein)